MKTILVLVIVIAVIVGFILFSGDNKPASQLLEKGESFLLANHEGTVSSYDISLADGITVNDIMGYFLPDSASNRRGRIDLSNLTWNGYVVADIAESDFCNVLDSLNLVENPNLLSLWPEAFECSDDDFKYWDISGSIQGKNYYYEDHDVETRIAVKYIDGKMYFKRQTEYTFVQTNKDELDFGKIRKLKKGEERVTLGVKPGM